jgi:signal transduction histidine kinase
VAVLAASWLVSRAVERQMTDRLHRVAAFFRNERVPASPRSLAYVREAFGVEVAIEDGAATVEANEAAALLAQNAGSISRITIRGEPHLALRDGRVAVAISSAAVDRERTAALVPLLAVGLAGALAAAALAGWLGARVASPVEEVAFRASSSSGLLIGPPNIPFEIQELVKSINALIERTAQAERIAASGRLAALLAHEIRNPLASVRMAVSFLRSSDPEACARIERQIEQIESAVGDLLDLSRPAPLRREPVDTGFLLSDIAETLRPRAAHHGVVLRVEAADTVHADPVRLRRAVWNLALNAIQASPEGGCVTLTSARTPAGIRISVRDEGRGVPEEIRDRVFEPFVTGRPDGCGLGLAVVRRVAEDHGGRTGFESTPAGTTFWIDLPDGDDRGR